jgi:hypothetical protein
MRNLKKLLAVVVAICVIATMTIPAFAAETKTDAQIVEILGVLKGDGAGVTDTYLAKGTNRMQAAQLYLRLIGLEDEALAETSTDNFDDANLVYAGGQRILAYLKAHPELGWEGVGGNKFEPTAPASAQMIYKVMLEALGYKMGTDFEWADTLTFAADKGLSKIADVTNMTNNDLAIALVEALQAKVKGTETTLLKKLIDDKIVDEAKAIEAGLIEATPAALEVVDVEADNLVRVVVTFNQAIDKDSIDDGDFEVAGNDIKKDDVSLSDDKKVATLKVAAANALSNGDEATIEISGIKSASGAEIKDYEGKFTPMDTVQPKVESIEFVGPETAKIVFSEPINESEGTPEITIDGGIYSAAPAAGYDNGTDVTVDLGTELDEGKHTFKVKGFEDFAGYSNLVRSVSVEYAAVKTAPSVTIKEATQSYVILKFERPVKGFKVDNFYQSYSSWKPLEIQKADGSAEVDENTYYDEVKLVFTDALSKTKLGNTDSDKPLPVGSAKVVIKDEAVEDRWGNKNDGDVVLYATITADTQKPTVTKVTVESEKEVRVYYSEEVKAADATKKGNFTIKNSKGEVVSSSKYSLTYDNDGKYTKISFNKDLDNGDYTITVEAIADTSLSANTLDTVTISFTITDKTAKMEGTVATWVDADKVLYVKYGDTMDATSVLNKANYRLSKTAGGSVYAELGDSVKLTMFTNKIVKMQFAKTDKDLLGYNLQIGRVKDSAGNEVGSLATIITITSETAPKITAVKKIADNKFELTVDQELKSIGSSAILVSKDGVDVTSPAAASYKFTNDGDKTKITITVPSAHKSEGTEGVTEDYTIRIVEGKIKSATGVAIEAVDIVAGGALGNFTDGVAPAFAKDNKDDKIVYAYDKGEGNNKIDSFIVKYSEKIDAGTVSKYTYSVAGYEVQKVTVVNAANIAEVRAAIDAGTLTRANGKYVVITVKELDDPDIDETPTVTQKQSISDLAGNELGAQDGIDAISVAEAIKRTEK